MTELTDKKPRTGAERIVAERQRQVEDEGYTTDRDRDSYSDHSQLSMAAAAYAASATGRRVFDGTGDDVWPWDLKYDKRPLHSKSRFERLRALEKAGALCAAAIDRLLPEPKKPSIEGSVTASKKSDELLSSALALVEQVIQQSDLDVINGGTGAIGKNTDLELRQLAYDIREFTGLSVGRPTKESMETHYRMLRVLLEKGK
jgi:hypothetical protein